MEKHVRICLLLTIALSPTSFGQPPQTTLTWRGCGIAKTAFMDACALAYRESHDVSVRLSGGGAALGLEAVSVGAADLGGSCRHCLEQECNDDTQLAIVAWDALVVVVHPSNPVNNLTHQQVKDILLQKVRNWTELGGEDARIVVVARKGNTSGVGYCTRQLILENPTAEFGPTVVRLNSSGPVEKLVERQRYAIAVTGISSAKKRRLKALSIAGVSPTVENISASIYPFFRPLYLAYTPNRSDNATRFVNWILSDQGQAVIEHEGTVSLRQGCRLVKQYRHFEHTNRIANYNHLLSIAQTP